MRLSETELKTIYLQALQDKPFSSATPILKLAGRSFDPRLGGNCIDQNREIAAQLNNFEDARIDVWRDERHHEALLINTGNTSYYVDAYLMMHHPLALALDLGHSASVNAYPHFADKMSVVEVSYKDGCLHVTKNSAGINKTEKTTLKETDHQLSDEEVYRRASLRPSLSHVAIRALSHGMAISIAYRLEPTHPIDSRKIFIKDPEGEKLIFGTEKFDEHIELMERTLGVSASTILQAIMDSASLYYEMRNDAST